MPQFCGCIEQDCTACFSLMASQCPDTINIPCGLTPTNQYYLWVRDLFNNLYYDLLTVNANGSVDLVTANFPTGMFTEGSLYNVFLTTNIDGTGLVTMNFSPTATCVSLKIETTIITDECGNALTNESNTVLSE